MHTCTHKHTRIHTHTHTHTPGEAVKKALTSNTAAVVASAPGFPHGVVDHIEDIAKVWLGRVESSA
eukprot:1146236-Pelagomonas_calceolata.AAC.2